DAAGVRALGGLSEPEYIPCAPTIDPDDNAPAISKAAPTRLNSVLFGPIIVTPATHHFKIQYLRLLCTISKHLRLLNYRMNKFNFTPAIVTVALVAVAMTTGCGS